jgi:transcriptional regulator with XRE-family HTH domain
MINRFLLNEFGQRIKQLRLNKKLSQEKLASLTGFHRTYIGMVERGERNISLSNMAVFAKVFDVDLSELLDLKKVNPNHSLNDYEIKNDN